MSAKSFPATSILATAGGGGVCGRKVGRPLLPGLPFASSFQALLRTSPEIPLCFQGPYYWVLKRSRALTISSLEAYSSKFELGSLLVSSLLKGAALYWGT